MEVEPAGEITTHCVARRCRLGRTAGDVAHSLLKQPGTGNGLRRGLRLLLFVKWTVWLLMPWRWTGHFWMVSEMGRLGRDGHQKSETSE